MPSFRFRSFSLFLAVLAGLAVGLHEPVAAQEFAIELVPEAATVSSCSESTSRIAARFENPGGVSIGGYQIFLRFSAEHFSAVDFEPADVDGFVRFASPDELADCEVATADPWNDGAGEDVTSVVATVIGEGVSSPLAAASGELGSFVFRSRGLASGAEGVTFLGNEDPCASHVTQTTRVFDAAGDLVPSTLTPSVAVVVENGGPMLEGLSCRDLGESIELRWIPPDGVPITGYRVYRDGERIREIPIAGLTSIEDDAPPPGRVEYSVALLLAGGVEGCRRSCVLERSRERFRRGDANSDGAVNVADAIATLEHLFGSTPIRCLDAADTNDDGRLNVTDPIALLAFLFEEEATPPAFPYPDEGVDPTEDNLGCPPEDAAPAA